MTYRAGWIVVSGAGGALGGALSRRLAGSARPLLALDRDAAALTALGDSSGLKTACADLCDAAAIDAALGAIPGTDAITLLVNAVGLIWNEPVLSLRGARFAVHDIDSFQRVLQSNLTAAFATAARVAARMARTGGGSIVNFSSIAAAGNSGQAAYSAAKAGVEGMTRAMAQELGPLGVRVNAVAPGFFDVRSTHAAVAAPALDAHRRRTPIGRLGEIDDLLAAIEGFEQNAFLTGVVLPVDGGLRL